MSALALLRRSRALLATTLVLAGVACSNPAEPTPGPTPPGPKPVASVTLSPAGLSLLVNTSQELSATLRAEDGTVLVGRSVSWSSDDVTRVQVDPSGRVFAVTPGSAKITATSEGKSSSVMVTATAAAPAPVSHIVLTPGNANLEPGQVVQTTLRVYDAQGNLLSGRAVTYLSSNDTVATVDAMGRIRARQGGTAWITAEVEGKTTRVDVQVPLWLEYRLATVAGSPWPALTYTVTRNFQGKDVAVRVTLVGGLLRRSTTSNAYQVHLTFQQQAEGYHFLDIVTTDVGTVEANWGPGVRFVSTTTPGQEYIVSPGTTYRTLQMPIEGEVRADLTFNKF